MFQKLLISLQPCILLVPDIRFASLRRRVPGNHLQYWVINYCILSDLCSLVHLPPGQNPSNKASKSIYRVQLSSKMKAWYRYTWARKQYLSPIETAACSSDLAALWRTLSFSPSRLFIQVLFGPSSLDPAVANKLKQERSSKGNSSWDRGRTGKANRTGKRKSIPRALQNFFPRLQENRGMDVRRTGGEQIGRAKEITDSAKRKSNICP